jgi:hypothetical protein
MRTKFVIGLFALSLLALPLLVQAQHAAAPVPAAHTVAAPPPAGQHVVSSAKLSSTHSSANHHTAVPTGPAAAHLANSKIRALDFDGIGSAPLGPHFVGPVSPGGFVNPLAATNEEVNQQRRSRNSNGIIFFGGGYGYDYTGQGYQDSDQAQDPSQGRSDDQQSGGQLSGGQQSSSQQQPQYIFVQQVPDPRLQGKQGSTGQPSDQELSASAEPGPAVPLRDVGSFTLVTRQGNLLDAVAFTRSSDRLVYITPDGGRRTLAFRDLDIDETQRLNTERGTPITIPPADEAAPPAKPKTKASAEITN